jgi:photosystem II stability/assembly factor-like uncharacterized protein
MSVRCALLVSTLFLGACAHENHRHPAAVTTALQWEQTPLNPCGRYDDIVFTNDRTGFTVNGCGEIYQTRDQGQSWQLNRRMPNDIYLRTIDFLDNGQVGFIGTLTRDAFYKTTDGGATWSNISQSLPGHHSICGLDHFGSALFAVGNFQMTSAQFFRSNDAGTSWELIDLGAQASGLIDVKFIAPKTGFVAGTHAEKGALILRTTNGGTTWTQVYPARDARPGSYPTDPSDIMWKLDFVDERVGYGAVYSSTSNSSKVVKTTDGGRTWSTIVIDPANNRELEGIGFSDAQTGWAGGYGDGVYETRNGGASWTFHENAGSNFNRAYFRRPRLAFASGNGVFRLAPPTAGRAPGGHTPAVVPHTTRVADDKVCVALDRPTHATVRLLDERGRFIDQGPLLHARLTSGEHCFTPHATHALRAGQYHLQFRTLERIFTQKFAWGGGRYRAVARHSGAM